MAGRRGARALADAQHANALAAPSDRPSGPRGRLFIATLTAIAIGVFLPQGVASHAATRWLIAWNAGAGLYVLLAATMMIRSSTHHMRHRAQLQDDGARHPCARRGRGNRQPGGDRRRAGRREGHARADQAAHIALAGATVLSSWAFIQVMFALHYAHDYYAATCHGRAAGLQFPEEEAPDYGDFFYFSAVIGTSGQTADVAFVTKPLRRIGAVHCILAYLFNTTVLALLINIGASLF
jgi:uncharacterized membrane protein